MSYEAMSNTEGYISITDPNGQIPEFSLTNVQQPSSVRIYKAYDGNQNEVIKISSINAGGQAASFNINVTDGGKTAQYLVTIVFKN